MKIDPAVPRHTVPAARELAIVVAVFLLASVLLTLPVGVHPTRTLPSDLVDTLLNSWIIGWDADRLRHLLRGVWDAPIYYPYHDTLAFSENLLGLAVFVAPVYWASGNAVLTYNIGFLLSFALAGIGMYLLVRALTQSRGAAAVAGFAYAFCPFRMAQIAHVQMMATGWIPFALWGLHEYFFTRARRWLAVFAGACCLQALSNTYVAYFMAVPIVGVMADGLVRAHEGRRRVLLELSAACLVVLVALAPVGAAYYRVRSEYRQVRSAGETADGGADVRSYLVGKNSIGVWRWLPTAVVTDPEKELFPGVFIVLLAALAVAVQARRPDSSGRWVWLYGGIACAGFLFSLGPHVRIWGALLTEHGPYDWLLRAVPGMNGMRVPARFAVIVFAALAVLTGSGASVVLARARPGSRPAILTLLLLAVVADGWAVPLPIERYSGRGRPEERAAAEWLAESPPGAVLHLPIVTNNFQELHSQFATLFHGHRLVNGLSGYNTPLQEYFRAPRSPLYDYPRFPATVGMLRALGVRYVIVHPNNYSGAQQTDGELRQTLEGLRGSGQIVREKGLFDVNAFELEPWSDPAESHDSIVPIPSGDFTLSVSEAPERLQYLVDGDRDTRWIGGQEGSSWIAARFGRPSDIARVELQLATRSLHDIPRELQIDVTDQQGRSRTVYRATPYPEFIVGFIRDSAYPTMAIALPRNETVTLSIRETASYPERWWSVHELRLWLRQ